MCVCVCVCVQLRQEWEIARQEVVLVHFEMISQYRQNRSGLQVRSSFPFLQILIPIPPFSIPPPLQAQLESGMTFKKSTSKGVAELDFVPVNLHIQQMKVLREGTMDRGRAGGCGLISQPLPLSLSCGV